MADISRIKVESSTYDIKDSTARAYNDYSSTEQVVGTYLGKPLYRTVVTETVAATTNTGNDLSHYGITNQDIVFINVGMSTAHYSSDTGKSYAPVVYYVTSGDRTHVYINFEGKLMIQNQSGNTRTFYICLEYTKTTD